MAAVYVLCPECTHTTNIHNAEGCQAYRCTCLRCF